MTTAFELNGGLPYYKDIELELCPGQNTLLSFNWLNIYRNYNYVPDMSNYVFKCVFIINSKLENEDKVLTICDNSENTIINDNDNEIIYVKLDESKTQNLHSYDTGLFALSMSKNITGTNRQFYRLCSGRWHLADNISAYAGLNQYSYNIIGNETINYGVDYQIIGVI